MALFRANLFVIQHLKTLYLGRNHVRVVCVRECEEKFKSVHLAGPRNWILRLAHDWQVAKGGTHVKHAGEMKSHAN